MDEICNDRVPGGLPEGEPVDFMDDAASLLISLDEARELMGFFERIGQSDVRSNLLELMKAAAS